MDDAAVRGLRDGRASRTRRYRYLLGTARPACRSPSTCRRRWATTPTTRRDGEVGKVGVAIDSLDDMATLLDGIPLDEVTTSMTINAPAAILLLLYELVGEEQGVARRQLSGTIQNDILKEYIARGTYIFPPRRRCG